MCAACNPLSSPTRTSHTGDHAVGTEHVGGREAGPWVAPSRGPQEDSGVDHIFPFCPTSGESTMRRAVGRVGSAGLHGERWFADPTWAVPPSVNLFLSLPYIFTFHQPSEIFLVTYTWVPQGIPPPPPPLRKLIPCRAFLPSRNPLPLRGVPAGYVLSGPTTRPASQHSH